MRILQQQGQRFLYLDLFRGFGALIVVSTHVGNSALNSILHIQQIHYAVVDFFFVLSGFVAYESVKRMSQNHHSDAGISRFLWKRFARLWPLVFVVLFASLGYELIRILGGSIVDGSNQINPFFGKPIWSWFVAVSLLQISSRAAMTWAVPLWSLAALWWGTVTTLVSIKYFGLSRLWALICFGFGLQALGFYLDNGWIQQNGVYFGFNALGRAIVGICVGLLLRKWLNENRLDLRLACFVLTILFVAGFTYLDNEFGFTASYLASFVFVPLIVLLAQLNPVNPSLRMQKVCNFAGSVAFPIFAWHWLAITVLDNVLSRLPESQVDAIGTFWPQYFLVMSLTLAFWKISSRFFEPVVKAKLDSFGNRYLKFASTPAAKI